MQRSPSKIQNSRGRLREDVQSVSTRAVQTKERMGKDRSYAHSVHGTSRHDLPCTPAVFSSDVLWSTFSGVTR